MFISGWNAVTHRSVQTKWGRGGWEEAASTAQFSRLRGTAKGQREEAGALGSAGGNGTPGLLSSTRLAEGPTREDDWAQAQSVGALPPCIQPSLPAKSPTGWIQFLFSLTKGAVSITGRGKQRTDSAHPQHPATLLPL